MKGKRRRGTHQHRVGHKRLLKCISGLSGIISPSVPPSCWTFTAQSSRISNLVCSCSWQCRLLPQACWSSLEAAKRWSLWPLPLSMPDWWGGGCCKAGSEPHSSVSGLRSSNTLNIAARTLVRNQEFFCHFVHCVARHLPSYFLLQFGYLKGKQLKITSW